MWDFTRYPDNDTFDPDYYGPSHEDATDNTLGSLSVPKFLDLVSRDEEADHADHAERRARIEERRRREWEQYGGF